jgi:tripartite-type tricarboxylate transporter receptor subunit TctC
MMIGGEMNRLVKRQAHWRSCWHAPLQLHGNQRKPVEIVVAAGAGGASDQMARMIQAAIQKNKLMSQPMVVTLKGAASGAEALMYMKSSDGDPTRCLIAYSLIYMLPLRRQDSLQLARADAVSVVAMDQFVLWDNTTLPYKNVKEFIAAAKAANPPFKMGGTGSKREDHVLTVFVEKKTGAKFAYLPYKSGGEAATQLVGNHTASNVNNPSENWKCGAPDRCARYACSTRSASVTRRRSTDRCRGTTFRLARKKASTSSI